ACNKPTNQNDTPTNQNDTPTHDLQAITSAKNSIINTHLKPLPTLT
ncbi:13954_t:CDS:1, partial [Cetraspora pellucida]